MSVTTIETLVVGAGIAGLRAARTLEDAGSRVLVLEKSRGFGGRAATKRLHGFRVDSGAQYFTARDPRFQQQVDVWQQMGTLEVWSRGFHTLTAEGLQAPQEGHPRYAFTDGMNTIGKLLAEGLDVRRSETVTELVRTASGWQVGLADGAMYTAERVLLNLPAPQALALAQDVSEQTRQHLSQVAFAPCLALMAEYREAAPEWSGIVVKDDSKPLSWLANDSSKHTNEEPTILVLHANPTFSQRYLETPEDAVPEMLGVAASLGFADPRWTQLQRWRYAKATSPYDGTYLKEDDSLFFCGDWCGGAKIEDAYLSGLEVAEAVLATSK